MAPKVVTRNLLNLLKPWIVTDIEDHPLYRPFLSLPSDINPDDLESLQNYASSVFNDHVLPAYERCHEFIQNEYLPRSKDEPGISLLPGGKSFYEARVRYFTTLDKSPDEIFEPGMTEVERIRGLMDNVIDGVGFRGNFSEFLEFLRSSPRFYARTATDLLEKASWLSKKAEGKMPQYFGKLASLPFTVEPVPESIAPNYTGGRYVPGSRENGRPGIYWVNTYNLPSRTLYTLPSLTLHEAVPGHHHQIMLASELEDLPEFRQNFYISAFGEGWGLYAEYLGEEMEMYTTPFELFGRYTYEMWRACRLVVDVGIHYKGWSRQQAIEFLRDNTALSIHEVNTEIDRYIGWPAQALSYKIGELTIKDLRRKAESELGEHFNIKTFHDELLSHGSVPLSALTDIIDRYIQSNKS